MKLYMCTLFDSNYLDKGIVLHESLEKNCRYYELYILPMDKKCGDVLQDMKLNNVTVLDYDDFEDDELRSIKTERSRAEFCWTCTAKEIKYVLDKYRVPFCTYIDSDLFFYEDPSILIEEMNRGGDDVQIVRHNFQRFEAKDSEKSAGTYCVEFNTFNNNENGRRVLEKWERECVADCSYGKSENVMGDQKYLQTWPQEYDFINVTQNQGAGVAPWNINKFRYTKKQDKYVITDRETMKEYRLVFYHFQNVVYIDDDHISCCLVDREIMPEVKQIYEDYLRSIICTKKMLKEKYGVESLIRIHPADQAMGGKKQKESLQQRKRNAIKKGIIRSIRDFTYGRYRMIIHNLHWLNRKELVIDIREFMT